MLARNFARTIETSVRGDVSSISNVRRRRSSATSRIVMIGTVSRKSTKIWRNKWTSVGTCVRNRVSVKVYPMITRKADITTYAIGDVKSAISSFFKSATNALMGPVPP